MSKKRKQRRKGNPANSAPRVPKSRVMHQITDDGVTQFSGDPGSYTSFSDAFMYQWLSQVSNTLEWWFSNVAATHGLSAGSSSLWCEPGYASDLSDLGGLAVTIKGFDPEVWRCTRDMIRDDEQDGLTRALKEDTFAVIGAALGAARISTDIQVSFDVEYAVDALRIEVTELPPLALWFFAEVSAA